MNNKKRWYVVYYHMGQGQHIILADPWYVKSEAIAAAIKFATDFTGTKVFIVEAVTSVVSHGISMEDIK